MDGNPIELASLSGVRCEKDPFVAIEPSLCLVFDMKEPGEDSLIDSSTDLPFDFVLFLRRFSGAESSSAVPSLSNLDSLFSV